MATAVVEEEEGEECAICHEQFTQPKILRCGHLLCRQCLVSWLKSEADADCPLCRSAIVQPEEKQSGKTFEELADGLPTDVSLEALIESQQMLSKDHPCIVCVTQAATSLCTSCGDFFCSSCANVHKRSTLTRCHAVEELTMLTPEKLANSCPSLCSNHSGEICRVYCPTHGASVCLLCATISHRQCSGVKEVDAKVQEESAVLEGLAATLHAGETNLKQAIQQLDQHGREMEKSIKKAIAEINAMCDRLDSALKACRRRLIELCQSASADIKEAVNEGKTYLLQRRGKLTTHNLVIERAHCITKPDIISVMSSAMKARVQDLDFSTSLPACAKVIPKIKLVLDPLVVLRLEQKLLELGEVKTCPADVPVQREPTVFQFHNIHGNAIEMSEDQLTAERTDLANNAIVMSLDPMRINTIYVVRIDGTDSKYFPGNDLLGVVTESPVSLPAWSGHLASAVVFTSAWIKLNGVKTRVSVGSALKEVRQGSSVGLMLDSDRTLHWYKDGLHMGVVSHQIPDPCYAMFDPCRFWKKLTALPLQRMI